MLLFLLTLLHCYFPLAIPLATLLFSHCHAVLFVLFHYFFHTSTLFFSNYLHYSSCVATPLVMSFLLCWCYQSPHNFLDIYWPNSYCCYFSHCCRCLFHIGATFVPLVNMVLPPILALCKLDLWAPSIFRWCLSYIGQPLIVVFLMLVVLLFLHWCCSCLFT
jgi:hypothetical protein